MTEKKTSALLVGYIGSGNFGDDAGIDFFLNHRNDRHFFALSFGSRLSQTNCETYYWTKSRFQNIRVFLYLIQRVNQVIWVGGTCFTDYEGDGLFKYMIMAKLFGKEISYIAVGADRLLKYSRKIKTTILCWLASEISVRDPRSLALLRELPMASKRSETFSREDDLACEWMSEYLKEYSPCNSSGNQIVIAWRGFSSKNSSKLSWHSLAAWIQENIKVDSALRILITDPKKDTVVSVKIFDLLKKHFSDIQIFENLCPEDVVDLVHAADTVITSRLHVAALGSYLGKKTLAYRYADKMEFLKAEKGFSYSLFSNLTELDACDFQN